MLSIVSHSSRLAEKLQLSSLRALTCTLVSCILGSHEGTRALRCFDRASPRRRGFAHPHGHDYDHYHHAHA